MKFQVKSTLAMFASLIVMTIVTVSQAETSIGGPDSYGPTNYRSVDPYENARNYRYPNNNPNYNAQPTNQSRYLGRRDDGGELYQNMPGHHTIYYNGAQTDVYDVAGQQRLAVKTNQSGSMEYYDGGFHTATLWSSTGTVTNLDRVYLPNGFPGWEALQANQDNAYRVVMDLQARGITGAPFRKALNDYVRHHSILQNCRREAGGQ